MNQPHSVTRGAVITQSQLDDAVHQLQLEALGQGMIPIAAILSRRLRDGRHKVLGAGWNHLAEGIPGIHGETGAIINLGRRREGYADLVATSSLSPCPFCQCTMVRHLGIREVRILDDLNYRPDKRSYAGLGAHVESLSHKGIERTFKAWLRTMNHRVLWERDIGQFSGPVVPPFPITNHRHRLQQVLALAQGKAVEAGARGEAPIGAVILDAQGEVIGCAGSEIALRNDPSRVAAMAAWRACGARDHWMDKTLVLTAGPDAVAFSMFKIFSFGQLVVASDKAFAGHLTAVRALNRESGRARHITIKLLHDHTADASLAAWIRRNPTAVVREYLGIEWRQR